MEESFDQVKSEFIPEVTLMGTQVQIGICLNESHVEDIVGL